MFARLREMLHAGLGMGRDRAPSLSADDRSWERRASFPDRYARQADHGSVASRVALLMGTCGAGGDAP